MADLPLDQAVARFQENEERIDKFVNAPNDEEDYETSKGERVPVLPKLLPAVTAGAARAESAASLAESSAAAAMASGNVFENTAQGLNATVEGQTFLLRTADPQAFAVYTKEGGAAVLRPELFSVTNSVALAAVVRPLRIRNINPQPSFADGVLPVARRGTPILTPVTAPPLLALGAVNGFYNSVTSSASTHQLFRIPQDQIGKYVVMSCYAQSDEPMVDGGTFSFFTNEANNAIITTGLMNLHKDLGEGAYLRLSFGKVPPEAVFLAVGTTFSVVDSGKFVTGVTYAFSDTPIDDRSFAYDVLTPIEPPARFLPYIQESDKNLLTNGDYLTTDPVMRSGSLAVDFTTQQELLDRGYSRGVQWRGGNDFARYISPAVISGKWVMSCFWMYSSNEANLTPVAGATTYQETDAGAISGLASTVSGVIRVSNRLMLCWATGQISNASIKRVLVGSSIAPVDTARFATGWHVSLYDDALSADAIDRVLASFMLNDKSRSAARHVVASQQAAVPAPQKLAKLVLAGEGTAVQSYVEGYQGADIVKREFTPFPLPGFANVRPVFNYNNTYINGVLVKTGGDDVAPNHVHNATLAANHGYSLTLVTAEAHGKVQADVGSIYSKDGQEYVLIAVPSVNTLYLTARASNSAAPTGSYSHVSGGANALPIVATASSAGQWYPSFKNHVTRCFIDGVEVTSKTGEFSYARSVTFTQSYDLMAKEDMVEWWILNGAANPAYPGAEASHTLSMAYTFDTEGNLTISTDFLALKPMPFADMMGIQCAKGELTHYYIPKALPFMSGGTNYDYAKKEPADKTILNGGTSIYITQDRAIADGLFCDRVVGFKDNEFGMALGFLMYIYIYI